MSSRQKKLMILGAGPSQLPVIRKAVDLGCYVITVDYLPDNIGHKLSHKYVNCSTVDKEGILSIAKLLHIDGVITSASDVATPSVGFVAEQLGLPGGGASTAETMSNKAMFRISQREHGLNCPGFVIGQGFQDIKEQLSTLSLPLMFKPVDTSGSRGISQLDTLDADHCSAAFEYAQSYSRSRMVCVEEFVEGVEVGGDGFMLNGRLFAVITHKHRQGFVPAGHSLPTNISAEDQERVLAELAANCRAVGHTNGALNFDVMVSPEKITVLEMSPRLGGNGIPLIIERSTGVDLITANIHFALGENVDLPERPTMTKSCGSRVFGSDYTGILKNIATEEELKAAVPQVFEYVLYYHIGDKVTEFVHSANSLGYALFDCPSSSNYDEIVDRLQSALRLKVAPTIK